MGLCATCQKLKPAFSIIRIKNKANKNFCGVDKSINKFLLTLKRGIANIFWKNQSKASSKIKSTMMMPKNKDRLKLNPQTARAKVCKVKKPLPNRKLAKN